MTEQFAYDLNNLVAQKEFVQTLLNLAKNRDIDEYIRVGINLYQDYFDSRIQELLALFPADYVDKEGKLFWVSPKRPPTPFSFDKNNEDHQRFVLTVVKILDSIMPLTQNCDQNQALERIKQLKIQQKKLQINVSKRDELTNENAKQQN